MKPTVSCILCRSVVSVNNISKHYGSKLCQQGRKFTNQANQCPHCNTDLPEKKTRANHIRWCHSNPSRLKYSNNLDFARSNITTESKAKRSLSIRQLHKNGTYKHIDRSYMKGRKHTTETKQKISEQALKSNHQRKCKSSHSYTDKHGRKFIFDSSWEDELANRLDTLNLKWDRPGPIKYQDKKGKNRKYYPDFYLADYNLYIDPKNSYAENQQAEKLEIVSGMINLIILRSFEECTCFDPTTLPIV